MSRPGRPIGKRIRQVCEVLENIQPAAVRDVEAHMQVGQCNTYKYVQRAVRLGLLVKSAAGFRTMADWRKRVDEWRDRPEEATPVIRRDGDGPFAGLGARTCM